MRKPRFPKVCLCLFALLSATVASAANTTPSRKDALTAMNRGARFMVENVAVHGGYVWSYLPDLSRRWGELEARPQMIWVQYPGTVQVGHMFLDAYHATGDETYYRYAAQVATGLMEGQLASGGWNNLIA